jgi:hypothetical protein
VELWVSRLRQGARGSRLRRERSVNSGVDLLVIRD